MPRSTKNASPLRGRRLEMERKRVGENLESVIDMTTMEYARNLFAKTVVGQTLNQFLIDTPLYDTAEKRWIFTASAKGEMSLEHVGLSIHAIVRDVLAEFGEPLECGKSDTREVVDTHLMGLLHAPTEYGETGIRSSPYMVIKATGPSFQTPDDTKFPDVGYSNAASIIFIGRDADELDESEIVTDLGISAKQIFAQQPNRKFVRGLYVTETTVTLVHYDRAGAQHTPAINIHSDPHTFIRFILGVSSYDEDELGLDTMIQWTIKDGKKARGSLTTFISTGPGNDDVKSVVYHLLSNQPIYPSQDICGRGTTCWFVTDPETGRTLFVKDAWRNPHWCQSTECDNLEIAKGLLGVAQVVSYEEVRRQISEDRDTAAGELGKRSPIEVESRIVVESYGKPIGFFESEKQLLAALRDAIAGHRDLLLKDGRGLLHRDISLGNILLGPLRAQPGHRGALVDLELSESERDLRACKSGPVGTFLFQSVAVLRRYDPAFRFLTWQDHLDDLESFFWVLAIIVFSYEHPNVRKKTVGGVRPDFLRKLEPEDHDSSKAAYNKSYFLADLNPKSYFYDTLSPFWSSTTRDLLEGFRHFVHPIALQKEQWNAEFAGRPKEHREAYMGLRDKAEEHYASVLGLFDEALKEIGEKEELRRSQAGVGVTPKAKRVKRHRECDTPAKSPRAPPRKKRRCINDNTVE